jgi:hemolysin activation/secretion protein
VIALRGQVSVGLPILGYSHVSGSSEDGTFVAGLLQAQWARRFDELIGIEVIVRGDLQLADQPLLPIEQFSIGGHASVRGYRENQIVRDNGAVASLEVRVPILRRPDGRPILQIAPFADIGRAWDDGDRENSAGKTLGSVGLGLRYFPRPWLKSELYWGYRISDVPNPHDALQDYGVQLRITATVF